MASKKKTIAQRAVGLASPVLPAPVAKVAGTRWGSRLFLLLLPFLLATGVLTISWNNGIPTVSFDRARAWIVGQQLGRHVEQEASRAAREFRERAEETADQAPQAWGQAQPAAWPPQPGSPPPGFGQQPPQQPPMYQQQPYQPAAPYAPQPYPPQQAAQPWGPRAYR